MINPPIGKEHFNLYYIFKEEKEEKSLSKEDVARLCKEIFKKSKNKFS